MICHIPPFPDIKGLEAFKQFCVGVSRMLTELRRTWDEVVIEENTAVQRFTVRGKHTGTTAAQNEPGGAIWENGPAI
jgi:hypothetical protein